MGEKDFRHLFGRGRGSSKRSQKVGKRDKVPNAVTGWKKKKGESLHSERILELGVFRYQESPLGKKSLALPLCLGEREGNLLQRKQEPMLSPTKIGADRRRETSVLQEGVEPSRKRGGHRLM